MPMTKRAWTYFSRSPSLIKHTKKQQCAHRKQQELKVASEMVAVSFLAWYKDGLHPQRKLEWHGIDAGQTGPGREGRSKSRAIEGFIYLFLFWLGSLVVRNKPPCAHQTPGGGRAQGRDEGQLEGDSGIECLPSLTPGGISLQSSNTNP